MAKQRLFPKPPETTGASPPPHQRFHDLASKVFAVPKSEIDKREDEWRKKRSDGKQPSDKWPQTTKLA